MMMGANERAMRRAEADMAHAHWVASFTNADPKKSRPLSYYLAKIRPRKPMTGAQIVAALERGMGG